MKTYLWYNRETGETRETASWSVPPDKSGVWERRYTFGIGRVSGAGNSPSRQVNQDG